MRLVQASPDGKLHMALTHGMAPFEKIDEPKGSAHRLLYDALRAASTCKSNEWEIVKAYRKSWKSQPYEPNGPSLYRELMTEEHYPNSAELLRAVVGTDQLSGGITECDKAKHEQLAKAWAGSGVRVVRSSWRTQLDPGGALACPDHLAAPWLFSMDPMTYKDDGNRDDANLYRSDLDLLIPALEQYVGSRQPGIASLFVYNIPKNQRTQFWGFMDTLARRAGVRTRRHWVAHRSRKRNLAGLLYSGEGLTEGLVFPMIESG